jgi:hypothetical protein
MVKATGLACIGLIRANNPDMVEYPDQLELVLWPTNNQNERHPEPHELVLQCCSVVQPINELRTPGPAWHTAGRTSPQELPKQEC